MSFKIALSAGHYKYTSGKRCLKSLDPNETREWVLNNRIADKIERLLENYSGYELLRLDDTTGKTDVSLTKRSNAANNFGADFYLSIHHNAGVNGGSGGGIVAFVYTYPSSTSLAWQKELYNALIAKTGLRGNRSTPLAKANLHECREPDMPAVLLELGFMDSSTDVPVILTEKFANQCAEAIVEVIVKRGKLIKKDGANTVATKTMYRIRKAWDDSKSQIGAYSGLDNAKAACNKAGAEYYVFNESGEIVYPTAVDTLVTKGVIGDYDYWINAQYNLKYLDALLNGIAKITDVKTVSSVKTVKDAINLLVEYGVISSPDYWIKNYSKVKYLDKLLISAASHIPSKISAYKVKVTTDALNIRKGPGTNYDIVGCIRDEGVYTVVDESNGWGKLKSGQGWVSLAYTKKV